MHSTVAIALGIAIVVAIPALLLLATVLGIRRKRVRLRRQTALGSATIVAMDATNVSVDHQPVVKLRMRLVFGGEEKVEDVELKIAVHPLDDQRVQVGTVFPIHFDPRQTADFSIDFGGVTGVELSDFYG